MRSSLAILLLAAPAAAEPRVHVGAELGASYIERDDRATDLTWVAPAAAVRVGYGLAEGLSVGLRIGASRLGFDVDDASSGGLYDADRYGVIPIDIAVTARYERARQWATPWLGWRVARVTHRHGLKRVAEPGFTPSEVFPTEWRSASIVAGLTLGYDVWATGPHRFGGFAEIAVGKRPEGDADRYTSLTLGLSYHR